MRKIDLTGSLFFRLTVISQAAHSYVGKIRWLCKCECGKNVIVHGGHLANGHTKSCGCLKKEITFKRSYKHGRTGTLEYKAWIKMTERCAYEKNNRYKNYGGRGIFVCERWKDFESFLKDMGLKPSALHSLDRIDNNGNYEPGNVRWATKEEQANNKRNNRMVTIKGKTKTLAQWCSIYGASYRKTYSRILELNWTPEKAFGLEKN